MIDKSFHVSLEGAYLEFLKTGQRINLGGPVKQPIKQRQPDDLVIIIFKTDFSRFLFLISLHDGVQKQNVIAGIILGIESRLLHQCSQKASDSR